MSREKCALISGLKTMIVAQDLMPLDVQTAISCKQIGVLVSHSIGQRLHLVQIKHHTHVKHLLVVTTHQNAGNTDHQILTVAPLRMTDLVPIII